MNKLNKIVKSVLTEWFNDCSIDYKGISEEKRTIELNSLKSQLARAAQKVYDAWDQDENGQCEMLGSGGICQDIADALCTILDQNYIECTSVSQQVGEQHVYAVAKTSDGIYDVDIPPYLYEEGGGYCWKKIPNIKFDERYVTINKLSADPNDFDNYIES
jgi:hypothetical protein